MVCEKLRENSCNLPQIVKFSVRFYGFFQLGVFQCKSCVCGVLVV